MKDRYQSVIAPTAQQAPIAPGQEVSEAKRAPSVTSDVTVPLLQAVVTAGVVTVPTAAIVGAASYAIGGSVNMEWTTIAAFLMFSVSLAKSWFLRLAWVESTIKRAESITGWDLNGNGVVEGDNVGVFISNDKDSSRARSDKAAVKRARFIEFIGYAYAHATDTPTLRAAFSQGEINAFRNLLIDVGCATWKSRHHNVGWEFVKTQEQTLEVVGKRVQFYERNGNVSGEVD